MLYSTQWFNGKKSIQCNNSTKKLENADVGIPETPTPLELASVGNGDTPSSLKNADVLQLKVPYRGPKTLQFFMTEWSRGKIISFDCSSFKSWMSSVYIVLSLQQQHVQIETQKRNHFTFNHWHFPSLMNGCCSARFKKFPDHSKKVKHSWST